jgi:hypothetical protein
MNEKVAAGFFEELGKTTGIVLPIASLLTMNPLLIGPALATSLMSSRYLGKAGKSLDESIDESSKEIKKSINVGGPVEKSLAIGVPAVAMATPIPGSAVAGILAAPAAAAMGKKIDEGLGLDKSASRDRLVKLAKGKLVSIRRGKKRVIKFIKNIPENKKEFKKRIRKTIKRNKLNKGGPAEKAGRRAGYLATMIGAPGGVLYAGKASRIAGKGGKYIDKRLKKS